MTPKNTSQKDDPQNPGEQNYHHLDSLKDLVLQLHDIRDFEGMLRTVLTEVVEVSGLEAGAIFLVEKANNVAVLQFQTGIPEPLLSNFARLPLGSKIVKKVSDSDGMFELGTYDSVITENSLGRFHLVPLKYRDELIGFILLAETADCSLQPEITSIVDTMCAMSAAIIGRSKTAEALRSSEELNRGIVNSAPIGIMFIDTEGNIVYENPAMARIASGQEFYPSSILGKRFQDISERNGRQAGEAFSELMAGRTVYKLEIDYQTETGSLLTLEIHGAPRKGSAGEIIGAVLMCYDLTKFRSIEGQLRQAQKMEAIGTLAGGIAHDFNNLLTGIMGNVELALMRLQYGEGIDENLDNIRKSSKRAAELTSQLLAFGRRRMEQPKATDLVQCIREAIKLVRRTISPLIEISIDTGEALKVIFADEGQMNQMLMNLMINACNAMPEGGILTINTENFEIDDEFSSIRADVEPGDYVKLTLNDTGIGIPPENLNRIFEPFFTTKDVGKGTGLGLAMVYGIVKGHKGWIEVESKIGVGTSFYVYLPADESEPDLVEEKVIFSLEGGHETVMLVDDDEAVIGFGKDLLENFGYKVIIANDGFEAVEIYRRKQHSIDLIILDLSMPRKSGRESLKELLTINPDIKVIVSSGFDKGGPVNQLLEMGAKAFVPKPYGMEKMLGAVRKVLDD